MKRARKWVNTPTNRPIRCQAPTTNQRSRNWHLQVVVDSGHMETCSVCRSLAAKWRQTDNEEAGKHRRVTWDNTAASSQQPALSRGWHTDCQDASNKTWVATSAYSRHFIVNKARPGIAELLYTGCGSLVLSHYLNSPGHHQWENI